MSVKTLLIRSFFIEKVAPHHRTNLFLSHIDLARFLYLACGADDEGRLIDDNGDSLSKRGIAKILSISGDDACEFIDRAIRAQFLHLRGGFYIIDSRIITSDLTIAAKFPDSRFLYLSVSDYRDLYEHTPKRLRYLIGIVISAALGSMSIDGYLYESTYNVLGSEVFLRYLDFASFVKWWLHDDSHLPRHRENMDKVSLSNGQHLLLIEDNELGERLFINPVIVYSIHSSFAGDARIFSPRFHKASERRRKRSRSRKENRKGVS